MPNYVRNIAKRYYQLNRRNRFLKSLYCISICDRMDAQLIFNTRESKQKYDSRIINTSIYN